jgi:hypothetical protein
MKKVLPFIPLIILLLNSCSPLNITTIKSLDKQEFEPIILNADYDLYNLRLDIIRQTEKYEVNDSTEKTVNVAYHPVGFNLGNGLFFDLNRNLSLLIPELFHLEKDETFQIKRIKSGLLSEWKETYSRNDDEFIIENAGNILQKSHKTDIVTTDSSVYMKSGILNSLSISYTDSSFTYKTGFKPYHIHNISDGYAIKHLLGEEKYRKEQDTVFLDDRYIIRNYGNIIEIYANQLFKKEYKLYTIIKSENEIYIYDRNYYGKRISKKDNELIVYHNTTKSSSFILEK